MSRPATDDNLLTYDDYYYFKDNFQNKNSEDDEPNPKDFVNIEKFDNSKRLALRTVLEELLKHLRNHGIFWNREGKACSYISYILSKKLKAKGYTYDQDIFEMFKGFIDKYNNRDKYTSTNCSTSLVHVDSKMYQKMNTLYALYDRFKNHRGQRTYGESENCGAFSSFLNEYKDFLKTNQPNNNNGHYKNVLVHFENKIKYDEKIYKQHTCKNMEFYIEKIKPTTLSENEKLTTSGQLEQKTKPAEYQVTPARSPQPHVEPQAPRAEHQTPRAEFQETRAESRGPHVELQTSRAGSQTLHEVSHSSQEILAPSSHHAVRQEVQRFPLEETHHNKLHVDSSQANTPNYVSLESPRTSLYPERYTYSSISPSANEVEMPPSSFINTITSTLKNVDPVPVVGVSGGMGALFLLFRYTPVGTFFRERGPRQRIPSRFYGEYPELLSGFQGYGDGYLPSDQINIAYRRE